MGAFGAGVLTGSTLVGFLTDRLALSTLGICAVGTIAAGQLAAVFIHPTFWATAVVFALAGVLFGAWGAGTTLLFFAVFMMLSLVLMLVQPGLRTLPKLSELEDVNS